MSMQLAIETAGKAKASNSMSCGEVVKDARQASTTNPALNSYLLVKVPKPSTVNIFPKSLFSRSCGKI